MGGTWRAAVVAVVAAAWMAAAAAAVAAAAAAAAAPECFSRHEHFFAPLVGEWAEGTAAARPYGPGMETCPLLTSQFSCGYLGNEERAARLSRTRYVPRDCTLRDVGLPEDAARFLRRNSGRTIVFAGDSMTGQHFSAFACLLRAAVAPTREDIEWEARAWHPDGPVCGPAACAKTEGEHASLNGATLVFPHNVTFRFHRELNPLSQVKTPAELFNLMPTDAIIVNAGLWYNPTFGQDQAEGYIEDMREMLEYIDTHTETLPVIIWRETSAQHFKNGAGGLFPPGIPATDRVCGARPPAQYIDARNDLVRGAVEAAGLAVLRVWESTTLMANATMWDQNKPDCTHYCQPGVPDVWADLVFNQLLHI